MFRESLGKSSIHGLQYVWMGQSNKVKVFWMLSLITSIVLAATLISVNMTAWFNNPSILVDMRVVDPKVTKNVCPPRSTSRSLPHDPSKLERPACCHMQRVSVLLCSRVLPSGLGRLPDCHYVSPGG